MRRLTCLTLAVALLALPALAVDKEERAPRFDFVDRLVVAFVDLFEKAGGYPEPWGLDTPVADPNSAENGTDERAETTMSAGESRADSPTREP